MQSETCLSSTFFFILKIVHLVPVSVFFFFSVLQKHQSHFYLQAFWLVVLLSWILSLEISTKLTLIFHFLGYTPVLLNITSSPRLLLIILAREHLPLPVPPLTSPGLLFVCFRSDIRRKDLGFGSHKTKRGTSLWSGCGAVDWPCLCPQGELVRVSPQDTRYGELSVPCLLISPMPCFLLPGWNRKEVDSNRWRGPR